MTYVRVDLDLKLAAGELVTKAGEDLARLLGLVDRHHRILVADADEGRPGDGIELGRDREARLEQMQQVSRACPPEALARAIVTYRVEGDGGVSKWRLARGGKDRMPAAKAETDGDERLDLWFGPDSLEEVLPDRESHCGWVKTKGELRYGSETAADGVDQPASRCLSAQGPKAAPILTVSALMRVQTTV